MSGAYPFLIGKANALQPPSVPGSSRRAVERRPTGTQSGAALFLTAMPGLRAGSPVPTWADQYIFSPRADQS